MRVYRDAIEANPENLALRDRLGKLLVRLGKLTDAGEAFQGPHRPRPLTTPAPG